METISVGVVGLGWIAQVVHLPILSRMPEVSVVAICDRDKSKVRLVGEKFGVKSVFLDVEEMLAKQEMDAVIVCTSTDAHHDTTLAALAAGKHVLVEKPIARKYSEAVEMAAAARTARRKLMVGMNHRFRPDTMILKSFLEDKEIGKVFYARAGWLRKKRTDSMWLLDIERSGGGVFVDLGIVMLDMALWTMGYPEVSRVHARHFHHTTKKVEDTSVVALSLANGSAVHIEVSWSMAVQDDAYYCHLFGTGGTASMNPLRIHKELHGNLVNLAPAKMESPQALFKRSYENELKHFVGAIQDHHPVVSTAEEGVQRMKIVDAIYKSARRGKEVSLS